MKIIKLILFTVAFLFANLTNAKKVDFQETTDSSFDNIQVQSRVNDDSSNILTQEVLLKLSSTNELAQIYLPLSIIDIGEKRRIYVNYKYGNITKKLDCKLICISEKGIFVYFKSTILFIPYEKIKFIQRGISFNKQFRIAVGVGGGVGFLYGLTDSHFPILFSILYGIVGAGGTGLYYTAIGGPINLISTISDDYRAKIKYSVSNGLEYRKKVLEQDQYYGNQMQIKDYPSISPKIQSKTIVPQNKIDTTFIVQENSRKLDSTKIANNTVLTTVEISKSTKDSVVAEIPKAAPAQLKVEFPNLNTPTDKINPQWMYLSFNKLDVNEKKLMSKFKNIQGIQMIAESLQNLNPSELQFLAMTIATLNGFNFKNVAIFSESQSQYLENYASYISNEVKSDTEIDPSNMQELDINNIKLIYSVLKAKMN